MLAGVSPANLQKITAARALAQKAVSKGSAALTGDKISSKPARNYSSYLPSGLQYFPTVVQSSLPNLGFSFPDVPADNPAYEGANPSQPVSPTNRLPVNRSTSSSDGFLDIRPLNIQLTWDTKANQKTIAQDKALAKQNLTTEVKGITTTAISLIQEAKSAGVSPQQITGLQIETANFLDYGKSNISGSDQDTLKVLKADAGYIKHYESDHKHLGSDFKLPEPIPTAPLPSAPSSFPTPSKGSLTDKFGHSVKWVWDHTLGKLL